VKSKRIGRRGRAALLLALCLAAAFAWDASRAPGSQWSAACAVGAIHLYQRTAAPLLARTGARCRFTPSCSRYAEASIERHGFVAGGWRAAKRVARCGPWTPAGTVDPPD
jgi:putative membrane protein insertion efficiency factor